MFILMKYIFYFVYEITCLSEKQSNSTTTEKRRPMNWFKQKGVNPIITQQICY